MPRTRRKKKTALDCVACLLEAAMGIDMDEIELLVQQAHECDGKQIEDPPEPFPVSRQALRMFWHFRGNLESVEIRPTHE